MASVLHISKRYEHFGGYWLSVWSAALIPHTWQVWVSYQKQAWTTWWLVHSWKQKLKCNKEFHHQSLITLTSVGLSRNSCCRCLFCFSNSVFALWRSLFLLLRPAMVAFNVTTLALSLSTSVGGRKTSGYIHWRLACGLPSSTLYWDLQIKPIHENA